MKGISHYSKAYDYGVNEQGMTADQAHVFAAKYDRYVMVVAEENMVRRPGTPERKPLEPAALWHNWNA